MQNIFDGDNLIAKIQRANEISPGLSFLTDDSEYLQVGTWRYDSGKSLDNHFHNKVDRFSDLTCECVCVLEGRLEVRIYSQSKQLLSTEVLQRGDFAVFLRGGHGYTVLEDDTRILEVKNGPFVGVDADKTRFQ